MDMPMKTKLTLTMDREIIERAKHFAKRENRSLSDIVENYLKLLTQKDVNKQETPNHPIVESMRGSFKMPNDFDYKKELGKRVEFKF